MAKDDDKSESEGSAGAPGLVDRRRFIGALGAGATSGLAGCGAGGDEDTTTAAAEDTTTTTTAESTTTTTAGEETTTTTTAEEGIERYDVTVVETTGPPAPPDVQYVEYSDAPTPAWAGNGVMDFALIARSVGDLEFYGEVASDWEYRPGVNYPTLLPRRIRASVLEGGALMWTPGNQSPAIGR